MPDASFELEQTVFRSSACASNTAPAPGAGAGSGSIPDGCDDSGLPDCAGVDGRPPRRWLISC